MALLESDRGIRADLSRRRLERVLDMDAEAVAVNRQITALVAESGTTLT